MLDHIGIKVKDVARSKAFYAAALAPLGHGVVMEFEGQAAGFGSHGKPSFWIGRGETGASCHVAFAAPDRAAVDAFYEAAIEAGGRDHGAPGVRAHYHANYYGAFVLDPNGHNVEAVCHRAP